MITSDWVKEVISGDKDWLECHEVVHANPPHYDEISVVNLYDYAMTLPRMAQYFPSSYPKGRSCDRDYFFSILATVHPAYFEQLIRTCKAARNEINTEERENNAILIT